MGKTRQRMVAVVKERKNEIIDEQTSFLLRDVLDKLQVTQAWLLAMKVTIKLPKTSDKHLLCDMLFQ